MTAFKKFLFILFLLSLGQNVFCQQERIQHFNTTIEVDSSGLLRVTEQLEIQVEGKKIKHGLLRILPLFRFGSSGQRDFAVDYALQEVLVNGVESKHRLEKKRDQLYIYVGDRNVLLEKGLYTYQLTYTIANQLGYFNNFDELYWNITGNEWNLAIDNVSADIIFPEGVEIIESTCATGRFGEQKGNCASSELAPNHVGFSSSNLSKREGLTIVVALKTGVLIPPSLVTRGEPVIVEPPSFIERNGPYLSALVVGILLLIYYFWSMWKYGIDPPKPIVYPRFQSPNNMSPAAVGYIENGKTSLSLLTSSILHLAINGYIKFTNNSEEDLGSRAFQIERTRKLANSQLAREEGILLDAFFPDGNTTRSLDGRPDAHLISKIKLYFQSLKNQWSGITQTNWNSQFWVFPFVVLFIYTVLYFGYYLNYADFKTDFAFRFLPNFLIGNVFIFLIYSFFIRRPSEKKLQIKADIDGFKMYMKTADSKKIRKFNPPQMTAEIFEQNLPYAIAFGVEGIWGKQFEKTLELMDLDDVESIGFAWLNDEFFDSELFQNLRMSLSDMARQQIKSEMDSDEMDALNGVIKNLLNVGLVLYNSGDQDRPSSGSGGGGFSGGGGGGGGGGGW